MLTLTYSKGTCARASHIALEESGADYTARAIDMGAGEQRSPEYLAINPKGRVPALVTDRGVLTETPAILLYIAQSFPAAELAPLHDPFQLAKMQALNSYLCATVHVNHAHARRAARWTDDAAAMETMKAKLPQTMTDSCRLIEDGMLMGPWVLGEAYSVADPYLFTIAGWMDGDGVDMSAFPRILAHRARMMARPAVQKVLAAE